MMALTNDGRSLTICVILSTQYRGIGQTDGNAIAISRCVCWHVLPRDNNGTSACLMVLLLPGRSDVESDGLRAAARDHQRSVRHLQQLQSSEAAVTLPALAVVPPRLSVVVRGRRPGVERRAPMSSPVVRGCRPPRTRADDQDATLAPADEDLLHQDVDVQEENAPSAADRTTDDTAPLRRDHRRAAAAADTGGRKADEKERETEVIATGVSAPVVRSTSDRFQIDDTPRRSRPRQRGGGRQRRRRRLPIEPAEQLRTAADLWRGQAGVGWTSAVEADSAPWRSTPWHRAHIGVIAASRRRTTDTITSCVGRSRGRALPAVYGHSPQPNWGTHFADTRYRVPVPITECRYIIGRGNSTRLQSGSRRRAPCHVTLRPEVTSPGHVTVGRGSASARSTPLNPV